MTADSSLSLPDEAGFSRSAILAVAALMTTLIVGMLNVISLGPFLPAISGDLHVSVPVLGQVSTVVLLLTAAIALGVGPLADHYGHRRFLLVGLTAIVAAALGTGLAPNFGTLLAAQLFSAVSSGIVEGICFAFAATLLLGEIRRKAMGLLAAASAGAAVVGVPLLTTIASVASWRASFFTLSLLACCAIPLVLLGLPGAPSRQTHLALREMLGAYRGLGGSRSTQMLLGASFLRSIPFQGFTLYLGAFLAQRLSMGNQGIGVVYMFGGGAFVLASMTVGGRFGGRPLRPVYAAATILLGAPLVFLSLLHGHSGVVLATSYLLAFLFCFGAGLGWVALATLLTSDTTIGYGTTMSINTCLQMSGGALGAGIGGLLLALGGWHALGIGLAGFAALSAVLGGWPASNPSVVPAQA